MTREETREIVKNNGGRKENVLGMLIDLQYASECGCVEPVTAGYLAEELGLTETRVYELMSYYAMLETRPTAKYVLMVCDSSPCHFTKAEKLAAMLQEKLGIKMGEATEDGVFALQYTPCVGACDIGPVVKVRDKVFGNLDDAAVTELIEGLRSGSIEV